MNNVYITLLFVLGSFVCKAQDFIRAGVAFTPDSTNLLGTFSFDLNRTESSPEKTGRHFYYDKNWYVVPSIDMNIGRDVSSSDNNVLGSIRSAYTYKNGGTWKLGFELSPTYHADKNFKEQLFYATPKIYYNQTWDLEETYPVGDATDQYTKCEIIWGMGIDGNLGGRISQVNDTLGEINKESNPYSTAGGFVEVSIRFKNLKTKIDPTTKTETQEPIKTWAFSLTFKGYGIISDRESLTTKDFIHYFKFSVDRQIIEDVGVSLSYKHGTDNPFYKQVHVIDLGIKVGFGIFDKD